MEYPAAEMATSTKTDAMCLNMTLTPLSKWASLELTFATRKLGFTHMAGHPATLLKPRKIPTQERSQRTWEIILEAGAQVLSKHGYEKTTTNLIADRAGVSVGTIYEYFPNKDVLLSELQSHWNDTCWAYVTQLPGQDPNLSLEQSIRMMFEKWVGIFRLNPTLYAALLQDLPTRGNKWKADARLNERIEFVAAELAHHADRFRNQNITLSCEILIRGVQAYLDHLVVVDPTRLESDELLDELTEQFCGFLLKSNTSDT